MPHAFRLGLVWGIDGIKPLAVDAVALATDVSPKSVSCAPCPPCWSENDSRLQIFPAAIETDDFNLFAFLDGRRESGPPDERIGVGKRQ
jgi:hypothetical protein